MGRSGFTDDGGASMMEWLIDSVESSIDSVEKRNQGYFDPDYLLEHEHDDDEQNLGESSDVMNKILASYEAQVKEEKMKNQKLLDDMLKLEIELAFQDQVIEELESKIAENQKQNEELKRELEERKILNVEVGQVRDFAMASWSVGITLAFVLACFVAWS
ncbi:uncharacterized protein LOC112271792 [Brachypodium distachyon]|uniref:Uncharacterized protein n=1 Tax=Brachypodium distachyon TaxID=15368 RepID=I1I9L8_BRADI|nr:uncharacterized protein LOC112271792 [Brachypodium distachyon]KQJ99436.1 hypothetical protein BRADI_3g43235v3 [Brachypodium distachyon]|eukprot:XP_024317689.1 uncharacterized protein LOC112271792 [Brachypodium distachyon]